MRLVPPRFGATEWLALAVLVLVPLLAVLQYRWLGQLSDGDRDRRQRTLVTAAQQLAHDVESELGRAVDGLQIDGTTLERRAWDVVAQRYDAWAASAIAPRLVQDLYMAVLPAMGGVEQVTLYVWDAAGQTFTRAPWPGPLAVFGPVLESYMPRTADPGATRVEAHGRVEGLLPTDVLLSPIVRVSPGRLGRDARMGAPDSAFVGFTIVKLDLEVLAGEVLPTLVRRHLHNPDGSREYRVALLDLEDPDRVVFESEPGAAAAVLRKHDASVHVGGAGLGTRVPGRVLVNVLGTAEVPSVQTRFVNARLTGAWRLLAAHESGSLEAAVAAVRRRNLVLSSSILLLLTVAIGLNARSARRARVLARQETELARQQMEFVAVVTHELRTPVAAINSTAGNLADGVVDRPEDVKTYGAMIQREARRLGETVERVLQLAALEAGSGRPVRDMVPPGALVRESINACRAEIARVGAQVEIDVVPDLPVIAGDRAALRSAVQNLVENACKYSNETPWVRVSADTAPGARDKETSEVRISVEDRGLGIAVVDRPNIFEPFYRGREALARQIQGNGLGLHLVARIVEAHGGRVTLTSEPGRGSRFTLHLPGAASTRQASTVPVVDRVRPAQGLE